MTADQDLVSKVIRGLAQGLSAEQERALGWRSHGYGEAQSWRLAIRRSRGQGKREELVEGESRRSQQRRPRHFNPAQNLGRLELAEKPAAGFLAQLEQQPFGDRLALEVPHMLPYGVWGC